MKVQSKDGKQYILINKIQCGKSNTRLLIYVYSGDRQIYGNIHIVISLFSKLITEASATDFLENLEEIFPFYYMLLIYVSSSNLQPCNSVLPP